MAPRRYDQKAVPLKCGRIVTSVVKETLQPPPPISPPASALVELPEESALRLGVHDLSRVEWTALLALPDKGERQHVVEFTVEIPANLYSPVNMWDYVQQVTRLQSPREPGALQIERRDADELRRDLLGAAHRLKQLRDRFERQAVGAASNLTETLHPNLAANFRQMIGHAEAVVDEVRSALLREPSDAGQGRPPPALLREWQLGDEWLSHQLLDFLSSAQRALDGVLLGPHSRVHELDASWTNDLACRLADALECELRHRRERDYLNPRPDSPAELSAFVERGGHLKKHFQDVLFLDVSAFQVDYRVRNWTGVGAATLAAIFWFGFTKLPISPGASLGLGVSTFALLSAMGYALKDRVKELTRFWLSGRLTRLYGQRMVTLRLPARADAEKRVVLEARETFDILQDKIDDPLNTTVQATRRVMRVRYQMRSSLHACPALDKSGIRSVKHIFRWDLTPIFSRLDNAVKAVPVLDPVTRRVRFVDAPKEYRLPVQLRSAGEGGEVLVDAQLVVSKRGLERLENFSER
jgi:hypothetical protein